MKAEKVLTIKLMMPLLYTALIVTLIFSAASMAALPGMNMYISVTENGGKFFSMTWYPGMWFFMAGMLWLFLLIPLLIRIILAYWVYTDAVSRDDKDAVIWLLIVLLLGLIGFIIYILIGRKKGRDTSPTDV